MFTTVAWSASQDSAVLINVAAVPDPHVRVNGNDIIVPTGMQNLVGVYGIGVNITRAQMVSPSLRRYLNLEVAPIDINTLPATPTPFFDMRGEPILLDAEEALNAQAAENGAGATRQTVLAWLADQALADVNGDIRSVRVTATTTLAAFGWTNAALTFDQTLPAGKYQLVGGRFESAGLLAWRCVFVSSAWRPGAIGYNNSTKVENAAFRYGRMGVWGEFSHNTPPTIDFLSATADTSEVGELDLLKIA